MEKDKTPTRVKFCIHETENSRHLFAFFPDIKEGKNEVGDQLYLCYGLFGQHSSACYEYMRESRKATPEEYEDLKKELENLGYNLQII